MTTTKDLLDTLAAMGRKVTFRAMKLDEALSEGNPELIACWQVLLGNAVRDIEFRWSELEKRLGAQPSDAGAPDEI